jgi:hypothetical protein
MCSRSDARCLPDAPGLYAPLLRCLSASSIVTALKLLLLEQSIIVHSRIPSLLTPICEALLSLLFPLTWQAPYVPQCPLSLLGIVDCPTAFLVGMKTELIPSSIPPHVFVIDLDRDR